MLQSAAGYNGSVTHVITLTRYLAGRGHSVLLVHRPCEWIRELEGTAGVERFETSFARRKQELLRFDRAMVAFKPDVVNTHSSSAHSYGAAIRLFGTTPVVATAHSTRFQLHWRMNHRVIATSDEAARFHNRVNFVPRDRIRTVTNFVDTERFPVAGTDDRARGRALLGLPADAFVVGSVGSLIPRKRPQDLTRAFGLFARGRGNAHLVICGATHAPLLAEVNALVAETGLTGRVHITGPRKDVDRIMPAFDVFALASGKESAPIAVLEAMSTGMPVVSTAVAMLREFVRDGETGFLVEVGDVEGIAARLAALTDPALRARLGAAGRGSIEQNYTIEKMASQIEAILMEASTITTSGPLRFMRRFVTSELQGGRAP